MIPWSIKRSIAKCSIQRRHPCLAAAARSAILAANGRDERWAGAKLVTACPTADDELRLAFVIGPACALSHLWLLGTGGMMRGVATTHHAFFSIWPRY